MGRPTLTCWGHLVSEGGQHCRHLKGERGTIARDPKRPPHVGVVHLLHEFITGPFVREFVGCAQFGINPLKRLLIHRSKRFYALCSSVRQSSSQMIPHTNSPSYNPGSCQSPTCIMMVYVLTLATTAEQRFSRMWRQCEQTKWRRKKKKQQPKLKRPSLAYWTLYISRLSF